MPANVNKSDMEQSRRSLLRLLGTLGGAGLAGCGAISGDDDSSETTQPESSPQTQLTTDTPPTRQTTDPSGQMDATDSTTPSKTASDTPPMTSSPSPTAPATPPFEFDVEVIESQPTVESPPILRIQITNTGEQSHSLTTPTWTVPINPLRSAIGDQEMRLLERSAVEQATYPEAEPPCWKSGVYPLQTAYNGLQIDAGDSVTGEYAILPITFEPDELTECWPAGTCLFSQPYWLDSTPLSSASGHPFTWDLEIQIDSSPTVTVSSTDLSWESN
jgi:hypothetical protein